VFPIYFTAIPIPVKKIIKKLDLKSTKYIFAIVTRLGTPHSAFTDIEKILKKKGKRCGTCEKVCLSKKIKMINKKPVWQKNVKCFYCYACINYCSMQSV